MASLTLELDRALQHQFSFPARVPHLRHLQAKLQRRRQLLQLLQRAGWPVGWFPDLLTRLRPLLSLAPHHGALLAATRQELARLNRDQLTSLQQTLSGGGPVLAIVGCRARLAHGQGAQQAFADWRRQGLGQPLLVTGNPQLADWQFRFCPRRHWLQLACRDSYEALPQKLLTLLWVLACLPQPPAVVKLDDDAQPADPTRLHTLLQQLGQTQPAAAGVQIITPDPLTLDRGWHIGKSAGPANRRVFDSLATECWLSGGTGYLLNGPAVRLLGEFALHSWGFVRSMLYEDVCVSMLLQAGHAKIHWLHDPHELGTGSERHQEIDAGLWPSPIQEAAPHLLHP